MALTSADESRTFLAAARGRDLSGRLPALPVAVDRVVGDGDTVDAGRFDMEIVASSRRPTSTPTVALPDRWPDADEGRVCRSGR
ncbi:hypothetical protein [Micromonospora sp. LOL_024]|uniref:hypothetical protein n=1 Tax=Micromonospora sp. LOL_024 TaxID=3345412 RepID=UPI003A87C8CC